MAFLEPDILPRGARVREYEIVRPIASGGFGDVYEAYHPALARRVALKILQKEHAEDATHTRQFVAEGRILAQIRSPHVVAVYDADTEEGRPWIAMELLEGRTLRELLVPGEPLAWPRALEIAGRIADGVAALHGHDIVHRDLKPENVFVTDDDRIVVMDLGIAKVLSASVETHSTEVVGTALYMSPEQIRRVATGVGVDARSDVYALSVMLYEMLSGTHPFHDDETTLEALIFRQVNLPAPPLATRAPLVPARVRSLVEKGLEKKPERRHASMVALRNEIAAAGLEGSQTPTSGASNSRRAIVTGLVVVGASVVGILLVLSKSNGPPPASTGAALSPSLRMPAVEITPAYPAAPLQLAPSAVVGGAPAPLAAPAPSAGGSPAPTVKTQEGAPSSVSSSPLLLLPNEANEAEDDGHRRLGLPARAPSTANPVPAASAGHRPVVL